MVRVSDEVRRLRARLGQRACAVLQASERQAAQQPPDPPPYTHPHAASAIDGPRRYALPHPARRSAS